MNRVDELFVRALESDPGARAALLDAECDGDAALRTEVESLLNAHAEMGDFMRQTAAGSLGALVRRLEPNEVVGGYKVVRLVGEGGSGAVYEAIQANPQRRVALKVMRAGPASESERERFAREARILARLEHPAVATIYEAGVDDNLSWFALEFVDGSRTLLDYAVALPVRDRLALFAHVCDAIHHGHQRGLLHRDIKPANLLIDAAGRPKVIDFGIARAVEDAAGEVAGTPPYMSPEQQAGGPLDVRSDVYSLGIVLRELVPEPEPDVASIARRALAPEPEARYVSAAALGDDVRRYLAHEPVAAHPQGAIYRVRKFARRQRLAFGALLAVFVVSVAAAVLSTRFAVEQSRARREAEFHSYVA
ncbi:MAG: serine/threonine protein kinase, partial [Planctomycetota bacterium]|nr:serine/threonine protein kinase [Planctomycetota bacterium]